MEPSSLYRPRVSRETRRLLIVGVLAIAALWLLARFRFRDVPVTPNPIPAVISQLANNRGFDDLAVEIAQVQARLELHLSALPGSPNGPARTGAPRVAALRYRDDLAVAWLPPDSPAEMANIVRMDPASRLAVVRVHDQAAAAPPSAWTPRGVRQARYFLVSEVTASGVWLRPVWLGALEPAASPLWPEPLWTAPERSDLAPGSYLFTTGGELVGVVIPQGAERVIVPAATLLAQAEALIHARDAPPGVLGIEVQPLTEEVAAVTQATVGVVVTWVKPGTPAAGHLMAGDVIEALDEHPVATLDAWHVRMARLAAGSAVLLRVRRHGEVHEVRLEAAVTEAPPADARHGLTLRRRAGLGAQVVAVERGSAAARAGLMAGDVITLVADVSAPDPRDVLRAFGALADGERVLLAVTRDETHFVTTLER